MSQTISFEKLTSSTEENQITLSDYNPSGATPLQITGKRFIPQLAILVLYDSTRLSGQVSGIRTRLNALGYLEGSDYSITGKNFTETYSGAGDIDLPSQYNIVFIGTNSSSRGATSFGTRLNTFLAAGNHMVVTTFAWNLAISQSSSLYFNYSLYSPLTFSGTQDFFAANQTLTINLTHPITSGLSMTIGANTSYNNGVTLSSGATLLASYSSGEEAIAIETVGSANIVAINFFPADLSNSNYFAMRNIIVNALLWCGGLI